MTSPVDALVDRPEDRCCANTDRELWREREGDYYADSIHVTEGGSIGMNCGGFVIVQPVRKWHEAAALLLSQQARVQQLESDLDSAVALYGETKADLAAAQARVGELEGTLASEKSAAERLAVYTLGQEEYDNSPCQAHPLELVQLHIAAARQANERLTIERDASIKLNLEINEEMQRLNQANGALEKDARRLDWFDTNHFTAYRDRDPENRKLSRNVVLVDEKKSPRTGIVRDNIRAAIDAALSAAKDL